MLRAHHGQEGVFFFSYALAEREAILWVDFPGAAVLNLTLRLHKSSRMG